MYTVYFLFYFLYDKQQRMKRHRPKTIIREIARIEVTLVLTLRKRKIWKYIIYRITIKQNPANNNTPKACISITELNQQLIINVPQSNVSDMQEGNMGWVWYAYRKCPERSAYC